MGKKPDAVRRFSSSSSSSSFRCVVRSFVRSIDRRRDAFFGLYRVRMSHFFGVILAWQARTSFPFIFIRQVPQLPAWHE